MAKMKMGLWAILVLVLSLGLAGCGGFGSVSSTYTISGKITDAEGTAMAGVELGFSGFGVATTAADGRWSKSGLKGTVTVTPVKPGYIFTPASRQVTERAANVHFTGAKVGFTITVTVGEGGQVKRTPEKTYYTEGETVTVEALADKGYRFVNWSGDNTGTDDKFTLTMNASKQVIATFEKIGMTTSTLGTDYAQEEGSGVGTVVAGADGTIWLKTEREVYRYSLDGGYLGKAETKLDMLCAGVDGVYGIDVVPLPDASQGEVQKVYQLDAGEAIAELGAVKFGVPAYRGSELGIDGVQALVVQLATEAGESVLVIQRSALGTESYEEQRIPLGEKVLWNCGAVVEGNSLYTVVALDTPAEEQYLVQLDLGTLTVQERWALPVEEKMIPLGLNKQGSNFFMYDAKHVARWNLGTEGTLEVQMVSVALDVEIVSAFPYQDGFVFSGWVKEIPGVYYVDATGESTSPVYQTTMRDEYLYGTRTVEVLGSKVYIPCRNTLKLFENDNYQAALTLAAPAEDFAINAEGVVLSATADDELTVIREGALHSVETDLNKIRVAVDGDSFFLIRGQRDKAEVVQLLDSGEMSARDLFTLETASSGSRGIGVLPDGNLVLGWNEEIRVYSRAGKLLRSNSMDVFDRATDLQYSSYFKQIVLLGALDSELYFLDPVTLKIVYRVKLKDLEVFADRLAIADDGTVYLATRANTVYKVMGIEQPGKTAKTTK